ncbi:MAG: radical SAM protein [Syntrophaceae bacterium CG2_30_49_12]|nr:MAG: radical SAM protein [Syntrophaceae bacterium CG2_30_49_12]PJC75742.1 MAG: radical SAM protein [Syntrophobacterales bacterium CG_4_8_14_3_um_filter_49_14]
MQESSYLKLYREGKLQDRIDQAIEIMRNCRLCPRECKVDRLSGEIGHCQTGRKARVASFNAHFGEEVPLVGRFGSGTIFISYCSLLCSFCQNFEISHLGEGREVDPAAMAAMMLALMRRGCHNINFVTPTHVVPQILEGLILAVEQGLNIPLVYNSGGYDRVDTLKILDGIFDIYMPDFKFWDEKWAKRFCHASDYREHAMAAIREMHRQVGDLVVDESGLAVKGLLVRHLVMPRGVADTGEIMKFLATEISVNTYVNIMDQYRPSGEASGEIMINRHITGEEFALAIQQAKQAGLTRLDSWV